MSKIDINESGRSILNYYAKLSTVFLQVVKVSPLNLGKMRTKYCLNDSSKPELSVFLSIISISSFKNLS